MSLALTHLTRNEVADAQRQLDALLVTGEGPIALDLKTVRDVDSAGATLLLSFVRKAKAHNRTLKVVNVHPALARTLSLFPDWLPKTATHKRHVPRLEAIGATAALMGEVVVQFCVLLADTVTFSATGIIGRMRGMRGQQKSISLEQVAFEMANMGSAAMGVVGLIAFLVGVTVALQSAAQLRQFGANVFVTDLMAISVTRELGPLMAAIVVAGRSGSAIAAEIATMVITEEVDALRTMGLTPTRFLVVPKFLAVTITQPLLTVMANALAIVGGFLVATLYLDVAPIAFMQRLEAALQLRDIGTGIAKSLAFGGLIVIIGALCGLRTQGGANAVGRSTTQSVVAAIFAIIVADAAFSLLFYFGN